MTPDYPPNLGAVLRSHRIHAGLTQRGVSARAHARGRSVSDSQLSKIERGLMCPRPSTLKAIADALGLEVADLLAPAPEPVAQPLAGGDA